MDGFAAMALASSLGIGVLFSALTVFLFQGGLALMARLAGVGMTDAMIAEMTATGGLLIIGIGLTLLELKRIRLASYLPGIFIAPLVVGILNLLGVPIAP